MLGGAGKVDQRAARASRTTRWHLGAQVVTAAAGLATVPLALRALGADEYGAWLTLTSFVALLSLSDLGLTRGLQNLVARALAQRDERRVNQFVATALALFSGLAAFTACLGILVVLLVDWPGLLRTGPDVSPAHLQWAAAVVALTFATGLVANIGQPLLAAQQQGHVSAAWRATGSLAALLMLLVSAELDASLPWMVLATSAGLLLAQIGGSAHAFVSGAAIERPRRRSLSSGAARELVHAGGLFLALQVAVVVAFQSDTIVVSQVLGSEAVPDYSAPARVAATGVGLLGIMTAPLWPAYTEAFTLSEISWIRRAFKRSLWRVTIVSLFGALALATVGGRAVEVWTGGQIQPDRALMGGLALWLVAAGAGGTCSALLNGAHVVRLQVATSAIMAIVNIVLSVILTQRYGVSGVVWGTVVSYAICVLVPYAFVVPSLLRDPEDTIETHTSGRT